MSMHQTEENFLCGHYHSQRKREDLEKIIITVITPTRPLVNGHPDSTHHVNELENVMTQFLFLFWGA